MYSPKAQGAEEILGVMLVWVSLALPAVGLLLTRSRKGKVREALVMPRLGDAARPLPCKGHPQAAVTGSEGGLLSSPPELAWESPGIRYYRDRNFRNT